MIRYCMGTHFTPKIARKAFSAKPRRCHPKGWDFVLGDSTALLARRCQSPRRLARLQSSEEPCLQRRASQAIMPQLSRWVRMSVAVACDVWHERFAQTVNCYPCPPGSMCENDATAEATVCTPGTYRSIIDTDGVICIGCPQGFWSKQWEIQDKAQCVHCAPGTVCPIDGMLNPCNTADFPTPFGPTGRGESMPQCNALNNVLDGPLYQCVRHTCNWHWSSYQRWRVHAGDTFLGCSIRHDRT